jgi:type III pantothenate kinase
MLIAIDIGNSTINIGFFTRSGLLVQKMYTHPLLSHAKYSALLNRFIKENNMEKTPEGIIISSVVPEHTKVLRKALKGSTGKKPFIVSCKMRTGLTFNIPDPEKLGSDRIANAAAAYEFYKCPVAVVDFGTATTISIVDKKAAYIGGAIIPGIRLMIESLAQGTSKLPEVQVKPPISALGKDTVRCIQSGLFYGTAGAVEKILGKIEKEAAIKLKVVITGGHGVLISKFLKRKHDFLPDLTLEGLRIIYKRNSDA